ncbi:CBF-domain-containing protein [Eremomyces bilateralis CBS 781.70]|uniref:CBF-domain-containing protein n=1 Tax=Eremomyces bilateralis CBS 781.70 TaxID=1392243 RepID=A0A6G1GG08_9PEZI|nr:CBF-domain-containing protein [Eremomyces bilateralis CBS 781.70]KAF1816922.1 CBF-domain-containing protein [Eremomyces bilateralis CBS 781.70]
MGKKRKPLERFERNSESKRPKSEPTFAPKSKKRNLDIEIGSDWHAVQLPSIPISDSVVQPPKRVLDELHNHANQLLDAEVAKYEQETSSRSNSTQRFMSTIMTSGTLEDKISALTLGVQESPLHNKKAFESLVSLADKRNRGQSLMALGAINDLLAQGSVLPSDRKLRYFAKNPALLSALEGQDMKNWKAGDELPEPIRPAHLIVWAFEDWLKHTFFKILTALETWCNDEVEYSRSRALTYIADLLNAKPEQEENLLRLLVNKVGDTNRKVASKASFLLLQLQTKHPAMKETVINAMEADLIFRPGQNDHAKYYAVITLNQTVLSMKEQTLANKLLDIYFGLFLVLLKISEKNENTPVVKAPEPEQRRKFNKKKGKPLPSDKPAEELNEKLVSQILAGVNRAFPFADTSDATFEAHIDTIFRVTHSSNFNTGIQALMLLQQFTSRKHLAVDRYYRVLYESLLDPRLLTSSKQIMYLNLLYKSLKSDVSIKRVKAFVKRLLQVTTLHEPSFVSGVLYLVHELNKTIPNLHSMLSQPEEGADDEREHFVDVPESPTDAPPQTTDTAPRPRYDPRKRDPEHSGAEHTCLWELVPYQIHYHPSAQLFGSRFLYSEEMPPKPDATHHTLIHFLDRFVYRGARASKATSTRGVSIMQPLAGTGAEDVLIKSKAGGMAEAPLNEQSFWQKKVEEVPVDEVFFHKYFNQPANKKKMANKKRKDGDAEEGSDADSEMGDTEVWKALVDSQPELEEDEEDADEFEDDNEDLGSGFMEDEEDEDEDEDAEVEFGDDQDEGEDAELSEVELNLESDDDMFGSSDEDGELPDHMMSVLEEALAKERAPTTAPAEKEEDPKKAGRARKRKLKQLPMFASADDYAKLLEGDDEE